MFIPAPTRRRIIRAASLICLILIALNYPSTRAQAGATRIESFDLNAGGLVRVENMRGAIRIDVWEMPSVRVVAEKRSPAGAALEPNELLLMGIQNTITVQCRQTSRAGRIDLTITVPRQSQLQVAGGAWPVEVSGALAGAVVQTTSGAIAYRIPANDDATVSLRTARGLARSTAPLAVLSRVGAQSLEGRLGNGVAPIILNSETGNITLTPGANVSEAAKAMDNLRRASAASGQVAASNVAQSNRDQTASFSRPPQSGGTASLGGASTSRDARSTRRDVDAADDSDLSVGAQPSQGNANGGNAGASGGNNMVDFAGSDRSSDSAAEYKSGKFSRPVQQRQASSGNSGLRVRIIPSGRALNPSRDAGGLIYPTPDDPYAADANATSGGDTRSAQPGSVFDDNSAGAASSRPPANDVQRTSRRSPLPELPDNDQSVIASRGDRRPQPPALRRSDDSAPVDSPQPASAANAASADEDAVVLKSALVNLNVSVTNRSGQALASLKKEDFGVAENGQGQRIEFFAPQTAPFNLVLVLDLSGSIKDKLEVVKSAALKFIDVLGPDDKVAVVTFTDEIRVISQLTGNRDELRRRIKAITQSTGGTAFYEAMWFSMLDTLRGTKGQRNAIVVMTDGVDSSLDRYNPLPSRVSFNQLAHKLEESDVLVFPVYLDTEYEEVFERGNSSSESYAVARDQLQKLSEVSGGQMFKAEKVGDLSGVYKQVAAAIRTVYSIGYYPTNAERDGTFRRVRVTVNRGDAAVRTRRGYYAK
ncbi:MAG TPA: VWA domain-containing protein [Blastocatellia bacterium]|nr:VWA domain-containing protein [Blastocatellia bacterium]